MWLLWEMSIWFFMLLRNLQSNRTLLSYKALCPSSHAYEYFCSLWECQKDLTDASWSVKAVENQSCSWAVLDKPAGCPFLVVFSPHLWAIRPRHWLLLPPPKCGVCWSSSGIFKQLNSQQMWGELQTRSRKPTGDRWNSLNLSPQRQRRTVQVFSRLMEKLSFTTEDVENRKKVVKCHLLHSKKAAWKIRWIIYFCI